MTCVHLQQLVQLCKTSQLKLSSSDLIHIVCKQCNQDEVCPSMLVEEYESRHPEQQELAPPIIQPMEILQLPLQELQERIDQELAENPTS